jgi:hypothetical protein
MHEKTAISGTGSSHSKDEWKFRIAIWNCFEAVPVVGVVPKTIHARIRPLRRETRSTSTHPEYRLMKKSKKFNAGKKRRQNENGQARLRTEQNMRKEGFDRLSRAHEAKPRGPSAPRPPAGRKPQRDEDELKRKLWQRKEAELEARWVTARARRTEEDSARKRAMKIAFSITGTVLAVLLCALVWYFARGGTMSIPA